MNLDPQLIREIREVYLVSNTPLYLYKRLRQLEAVHHLASAVTGKDLLAEYLKRAKAKDRTPDDVAIAYACLVAITLRDLDEADPLLRSLESTSLNWAPAIRDLCFAKTPVGKSHRIIIERSTIPAPRPYSDAPATVVTTGSPKPRVQRKANQ